MERASTASSLAQEDRAPDAVIEQLGNRPTQYDDASQDHESVPESPVRSAFTPHPLQRSSSVQNPAKKKLSFSSVRSEECSQSHKETDDVLSFLRGPSAVADVEKSESRTSCPRSYPHTTDCRAALDAAADDAVYSTTSPSFAQIQSHGKTGASDPTTCTQVDADSCCTEDRYRCGSPPSEAAEGGRLPGSGCGSYLTSEDFVVSAVSARGCSTPKQSTLVAPHRAKGLQQTLATVSSSSIIDLVDDNRQPQMNLKPSSQPSMVYTI